MSVATFVKRLDGWSGDAHLYRVDPPMRTDSGDTDFVVVSAVVAKYSGPETYIFAAGADGEVSSWLELDGSFRGALDHDQALRNAGYEVSR